MTKQEAKKIACQIVASYLTGSEDITPICEMAFRDGKQRSTEDMNRLIDAFEELAVEMERRAGSIKLYKF